MAESPSNLPAAPDIPLHRRYSLLDRVIALYERNFTESDDARGYMLKAGITDGALYAQHRIGYANGSLPELLPLEGEIMDELVALGVIGTDRTEFFKDHVVIPVFNTGGRPTNLCGFPIAGGEPKFLPEHKIGIWNIIASNTATQLIVTKSILDGLSVREAGFSNVISLCDVGISDREIEFIQSKGVKVLGLHLASQDLDLVQNLLQNVFKCPVYPTPDGMQANAYLNHRGKNALATLLSSPPQQEGGACESIQLPSSAVRPIPGGFSITCGVRRYEILGLEQGMRKLKCTVRIEHAGRLHVDTIDLYQSRARVQLCRDICRVFDLPVNEVESELRRLVIECENPPRDTSGDNDIPDDEPTISPDERREAESFGKSERLIDEILEDFERCGLIGEDTNKLLCYLAMTSRKMPSPHSPLCILTLSSSGAGKTALQDSALQFCPPEDLVKLTSLSGKALFYKAKNSLKHKVLAFEERAGVDEASYAIRSLISSGALTIEATVRDGASGRLTTMENTVEGPTAVFCTTTNPNVDPETRSRFLVTGIDESSAQTQAILSFQRRYHSPDSLEVDSGNEERLRIHRNFQRLLKNVRVINPFANQLVYDDFRLGARRLQPQYLNLISAIAFLRQMCKGVQVYYPGKGRQPIEYVEVDETDIEIGNRLAVEVLGRTLDELSIPARDLLTQIVEYVDSRIRHESQGSPSARLSRTDITFNRRDIREFTCWTNTRLHTHLRELIDLDYVIIESGRRNSLQTYRLLYSGQGDDGQRFIIGLKPFDNAT